jgi:hypothetical protein
MVTFTMEKKHVDIRNHYIIFTLYIYIKHVEIRKHLSLKFCSFTTKLLLAIHNGRKQKTTTPMYC